VDFIADTGDGGNPTYAVARALASPAVTAPIPPGVCDRLQPLKLTDTLVTAGDARLVTGLCKQAVAGAAGGKGGKPGAAGGKKPQPALSGAQQQQQELQQQQEEPPQQQRWVRLPRADVLLIGGDLAYPNPCRETYEQRLFLPFQDALPPPPHYHPGRLVVHKPDLPPAYGVQVRV
jgi:hypothetical protein